MLFLNLPDDKLGVEKRFREAIEAKGSKPLLLIKKEMKEELGRSMVGWLIFFRFYLYPMLGEGIASLTSMMWLKL